MTGWWVCGSCRAWASLGVKYFEQVSLNKNSIKSGSTTVRMAADKRNRWCISTQGPESTIKSSVTTNCHRHKYTLYYFLIYNFFWRFRWKWMLLVGPATHQLSERNIWWNYRWGVTKSGQKMTNVLLYCHNNYSVITHTPNIPIRIQNMLEVKASILINMLWSNWNFHTSQSSGCYKWSPK